MNEKKWWVLATAVIGICVIWFAGCEKLKGPAPSVSKDVVATVNNHVITLSEVDGRISKMPAYYQQMLKDRKRELVDDLVLEYLLYDEARRKNLQNDKEIKELLEEARRKILIAKLIKDEVDTKAAVSDKEVEDYYNANKDQYALPERWRASHILVKTEKEAKAILDELSKGKAFEELAKEKSEDTTAKRGGDLGYFTKNQLTPEFEDAAVKLKVGEVSGVVKTGFGYHIIKLTDHKDAQAQEFKDVKERIRNELLMKKKKEAFEALVANLKKGASIKMNEEILAPAPESKTNE